MAKAMKVQMDHVRDRIKEISEQLKHAWGETNPEPAKRLLDLDLDKLTEVVRDAASIVKRPPKDFAEVLLKLWPHDKKGERISSYRDSNFENYGTGHAIELVELIWGSGVAKSLRQADRELKNIHAAWVLEGERYEARVNKKATALNDEVMLGDMEAALASLREFEKGL